MDMEAVPEALKERLGIDATSGLLGFMDRTGREWKTDVMTDCAGRFEYRLVQEVSGLRVQNSELASALRQDMGKMEAALRQDMGKMEAGLRQDMGKMEAGLRQDMTKMEAGLRQDMTKAEAGLRQDMTTMDAGLRQAVGEQGAALRVEIANNRAEIIKWCFLFWIGQVVTLSGIMALMLRLYRP